MMEDARPPGYCAQTLVYFGGMAVTALLDSGATCSGMPEEVADAMVETQLAAADDERPVVAEEPQHAGLDENQSTDRGEDQELDESPGPRPQFGDGPVQPGETFHPVHSSTPGTRAAPRTRECHLGVTMLRCVGQPSSAPGDTVSDLIAIVDIGTVTAEQALDWGFSGPMIRASGLPWDLRKSQPYCGYETYEFEVATADTCDAYGRFLIRLKEMEESLKIVEQCLDRLKPGPVMVEDKKIAWPAQLAVGADGQGNSLAHIKEIMGESMESLIHHFKLVTEGFEVPAGQVYQAVESPRGELGVHRLSDGGTRPYRVHYRDPSFNNLQAMPAMAEGGQVADLIAVVASIDPVMGGVDR